MNAGIQRVKHIAKTEQFTIRLTGNSKGGFLALALLLLVLTGCSDSETTSIRFGLSSSPVTLDPRYATDAVSSRINRLLYRRLVDFDAQQNPVADLASWEQLSSMHYRFHLGEDGRRFHNGTRLTAQDVKATYDSVLDASTASPHRGGLGMIERIDIVDDDTVDFLLARPEALFAGRLVLGVLPHALVDKGARASRNPVGSGSFEFQAWPQDGRLSIRRIADGQLVEFVRVPESTVRVLKLARGEIDLLQGDLSQELLDWLDERDDVTVNRGPGSNFAYLGFNLEDPITGDPVVREAIAHAIDRRAIIEHILGGGARPASAILPPDHWAGNDALPLIAYSPDRARALLATAGFGVDPLRIVYKTSNNPLRVRIATVIQEQLSQVGIDVALKTYDWGTFYGDVKAGRFQMYSLAWVGIKMPDIFRYAMHSESIPPAGANRGRYASVVADRLIDDAEAATNLETQAARYRELQEHLLEELPYVPLWYEDRVFAARADIKGYELAVDGNYDALKHVSKTPGS